MIRNSSMLDDLSICFFSMLVFMFTFMLDFLSINGIYFFVYLL